MMARDDARGCGPGSSQTSPNSQKTWVECGQCEDGYSYHDCGEDTCCCADPQPNVICDTCGGKGGWYIDEWLGETITQDELDVSYLWRTMFV